MQSEIFNPITSSIFSVYVLARNNRPVACKQWNFNEILITLDVTTGCCGCWRKCMESIGETSGSAHKASTGRQSIPYVLVLRD